MHVGFSQPHSIPLTSCTNASLPPALLAVHMQEVYDLPRNPQKVLSLQADGSRGLLEPSAHPVRHQKPAAVSLVYEYLRSLDMGDHRQRAENTVFELFREHHIHAPSVAKSNLRKLPVGLLPQSTCINDTLARSTSRQIVHRAAMLQVKVLNNLLVTLKLDTVEEASFDLRATGRTSAQVESRYDLDSEPLQRVMPARHMEQCWGRGTGSGGTALADVEDGWNRRALQVQKR